jgi:hypothetical protein
MPNLTFLTPAILAQRHPEGRKAPSFPDLGAIK